MTSISLSALIGDYRTLIGDATNFELYNQMLHTHHSTAIEGNRLIWLETKAFLEKGITVGGKPMEDHLMVLDHQHAQAYILDLALQQKPFTRQHLQEVAGKVVSRTGGITQGILGNFDSTKGEFRTVTAWAGNRMFMDSQKIPTAVDSLLQQLNTTLPALTTSHPIYEFSFEVHFRLVNIHPFGDGNGRTSRLLMNYVQQFHQLPLSLVNAQDKSAYLQALEDSRQRQSVKPINKFMYAQLLGFLQTEITRMRQ